VVDVFVSIIVGFLTSLRVYSVICAVSFYRRARRGKCIHCNNRHFLVCVPDFRVTFNSHYLLFIFHYRAHSHYLSRPSRLPHSEVTWEVYHTGTTEIFALIKHFDLVLTDLFISLILSLTIILYLFLISSPYR